MIYSSEQYLDDCLRLRGGVAPDEHTNRAVREVLSDLAAARREVETAQAEARLRGETIDALRKELAAEQENNTLIAQAANFNAALAIEELRVEALGDTLHTANDGRVRGLCANCLTWHDIGDMWAECRACFDETTGKAAQRALADVTRERDEANQKLANLIPMPTERMPADREWAHSEWACNQWYLANEAAMHYKAERDTAQQDLATSRAALEDVRRVEAWLAMDPARRQVRMVTGKLQAVRDVSLGLAPHWIVVAVADAIEALGRALAQEAGTCDHTWVDARNARVQSGEVCVKCGAIRAGNTAQEAGDAAK